MGLPCVSSFSFDSCSHSLFVQAHLLLGSRPFAFRLMCTVVFSHISICESSCVDRRSCRHQRTRSGNSSTHPCRHSCLHRTPRYAYAVAQTHEHSDVDQSDNHSQLKQECTVDSLDACIRELQRQARSNQLELGGSNCGCEES